MACANDSRGAIVAVQMRKAKSRRLMASPRRGLRRVSKENITYWIRIVPFVTLKQAVAMSALGQKQTSDWRPVMSALPPKADVG
jgi:hypothetical protein